MDIKKQRGKGKKIETEKDMVLKKHVGLIHCENKLTLVQRKICNILLFNALDQINDKDIHEISIKKLCSLVGYNSNDSKLIKESVKTLISTIMEWNLLDDKKINSDHPDEAITWNASALLAGTSIRAGVIQYSYSPQMRAVLSSLDIYGRINLFVQAKFNSSYSLVLYENCVRYKNVFKTAWFSVDLFRSLMGVPEGKYASFKELKRNVVNVAIKEINEKSDIHIEAQFKRSSRTITAIQFLVNENENYSPSFKRMLDTDASETSPAISASLVEMLVSEFMLSKKQALDIVSSYQSDYVAEKIKLVQKKSKVSHPGAYLLSALKEDYQVAAAPAKRVKAQPSENSYLREMKKASEIMPLKNKYMSYKLQTYLAYIQEQAEAIQHKIKEKFERFIAPRAEVVKFYKKSGYKSPFVMSEFILFVDQEYPHVVKECMSFDDYLTAEVVD